MGLDVLCGRPKDRVRPTPLLFVHGAYSSAELWAPFFLPWFASRGYAAHALSLRGHGASAAGERSRETRLRDYVADVIEVAGGLPAPPVLIGHSMGGMIVQKVIETLTVPAIVLMASAPPHGILANIVGAALFNPVLALQMGRMQSYGPGAATLDGARRALFRSDTPDDYIRRVLPPAYGESDAVMLDMIGRDLPPSSPRRDIPALVLGGEKDTCISTAAVQQTALAFGTRAEILPGMPHALMLDPEWETVARRIGDWLETTLP
jgi:pimeloyl-ACP methyl ester carboxylesterase